MDGKRGIVVASGRIVALHGRFEGGALRLVEFPAVIEIHHARVVLLQGEVRHVAVELLAAHVFVGVEQAGRAAQQVGIRLEARCDVFLGIARQIVEQLAGIVFDRQRGGHVEQQAHHQRHHAAEQPERFFFSR